jgi:hypothetical protein
MTTTLPINGLYARAALETANHLYNHEVKRDGYELPPNFFPRSYGHLLFGEIVVVLQGLNVQLKQQALVQAIQLLQDPQNIVRSLKDVVLQYGEGKLTQAESQDSKRKAEEAKMNSKARPQDDEDSSESDSKTYELPVQNFGPQTSITLFDQLMNSIHDSDTTIRTLACQALACITKNPSGLQHAVKQDIYNHANDSSLIRVMKEYDPMLQYQALSVFLNLCNSKVALQLIFARALQVQIIQLAQNTLDHSVLAILFEICSKLIEFDTLTMSKSPSLMKLLVAKISQPESTPAPVLQHACKCIVFFSIETQFKKLSVEADVVAPLVRVLEHIKDESVLENAASALMYITILLHGKEDAIKSNAIPILIALIQHDKGIISANALQALNHIAEHPQAYTSGLLRHDDTLSILHSLILDDSKRTIVRNAAKNVLARITWTP